MDEYQHAMRSFFETAINRKGHSAAALVHQHYPYDQRNLNCWIDLARDVDHMLKSEKKSIEGRETLLVSIGEAGHDG